MKLVIFGLSISSSWGNGHATLLRGLCRALAERSYELVFFEKDVPYYAEHRDLTELPGLRVILYREWFEVMRMARAEVADSDVSIVTSYCPDGVAASELTFESCNGLRVFYDLDTPVTLSRMSAGESLTYIGPRGLRDFDLVLSYTGGTSLKSLVTILGARRVEPLYGCVDPEIHHPIQPVAPYRSDLSYLGTYSDDRQAALEMLLLEPARRLPSRRFLIGGAMYPPGFPWAQNISFVRHLAPPEHPAFYCSSRITLNVTRRAMADTGYCPSARLFEAAACGVPVLSDWWEGLDQFFEPGREILVAHSVDEALAALEMPSKELARITQRARERVLAEHTAAHRARELEALFDSASIPVRSELCGE
jgi:spore maturation protein CgeB